PARQVVALDSTVFTTDLRTRIADAMAVPPARPRTPAGRYVESNRCQSISSPSTMAHNTPSDPGAATKAVWIGLFSSGRNRSVHPRVSDSAVETPPIREAHAKKCACQG